MQHVENEIQLEIELLERKQISKAISRFLCENVYKLLLYTARYTYKTKR